MSDTINRSIGSMTDYVETENRYLVSMGRPLRIDYPNTFHHVMNRAGAQRWPFMRDDHYLLFLDVLADTVRNSRIEVHAYCLMGNHFHLLLRSPFGTLSEAMQRLSSVFTKRYNKMEKIDGSLFRGRFKSIPVLEENYLSSLYRYIHRNPVEASLILDAQKYPWSSYQYYRGSPPPPWLTISTLPTYFSDEDAMRSI